ncbi:MAG: amino acid permease, partial [Veillonella sp.]|nr:amino acid permease [Veillonella sp.]
IALLFTPIWFVILWAFYSMLNTGDEDTLEEELLDLAGAKKQAKKQTTDDHDDYVI